MNNWTHPRPHTDASLRFHHYGRIEPLQVERSWAQAAGSAIVCLAFLVVAGFVLGVVVS